MTDTILTVSLQKASQQIAQRIKIGRDLMQQPTPKTLDKLFFLSLWDELKKWDDYNTTLLRSLFSDDSISGSYSASYVFRGYSSIRDLINKISTFYRIKIRELESLKERLHLYNKSKTNTESIVQSKCFGQKVFIVHGHDETTKQSVARFLEKLDLEVVILHEQADKGRTVIEKLEANSPEVEIGYAVVLLTPDDIGRLLTKTDKTKPKPPLHPRARQNVVFELGYFIAKLGRERVRALYVEGVEQPSDYQGVLYTKLDDSGSWKLELAREIKAVGINIDMNKIL